MAINDILPMQQKLQQNHKTNSPKQAEHRYPISVLLSKEAQYQIVDRQICDRACFVTRTPQASSRVEIWDLNL